MKNAPVEKKNSMAKYAAFLRGINVGGNKLVKMEDLKKAFLALGFQNVKTLLASGNVLFETSKSSTNVLAGKIEEKLKSALGHEVGVIVRPVAELQRLVDLNPFEKIKVTPRTRLYVTFLPQKPKAVLKLPYESPEKDFRILQASESEVCSVITLSPTRQTTELMAFLDKEFGKRVTTRNWNTIVKILKG